MKILQVIGSMDPKAGGPCQVVRDLAAQAAHDGATMEVVCLDDPQSEYLKRETVSVHALGKSRGAWGYHAALRPWLESNVRRFDAVILNGLWQYHGYTVWKVAKASNAPPYYLFPHGMLDPWFQRVASRRLKAARNWIYWKLVEQHIIHSASAVLFTSAEELRLAHGTFSPYRPKREVNVSLGIVQPPEYREEMRSAFEAKCPAIKAKTYLLFLGRIHPKKGVHILIEAYAALCKSAAGAQPLLVIAGPDAEGPYGAELQKLARETCPSGSVLWPGMLTGDAKWGAFYRCDAFVLPSSQENFGIAVVETLACGRPVLISDQINIWREIKDDGAGLVEPNTVEGTTRLLLQWQNASTESKLNMAVRAKPCFQRNFSIERTCANLLSVMADRKADGVAPLSKR
jgi:glycosyltransferase involved in cell wall biosynthesis